MKKKYFKYFFLITIILAVFSIYKYCKVDKLNYIALGDSLAEGMNSYGQIGYSYTDYLKDELKKQNRLKFYTKEYTESGYETSDLITDIHIKNELKHDLRESNLVTLSIGANNFLHNINLGEVDVNNILSLKGKIEPIFTEIDECVREIRKYAKKDIIIVGYYNPIPFLFNTSSNDLDELFAYIDEKYNNIAKKYDCIYVSLYNLFKKNKDYLPNPMNIHPSGKGYKAITKEILEKYLNN